MTQAWQFVKRNGMSMSEALRIAWRNAKLVANMRLGIVKFHFVKVDGSVREAYGTLAEGIMPTCTSTRSRKANDSVQTYYDTEKAEFRCFKRANLLSIG